MDWPDDEAYCMRTRSLQYRRTQRRAATERYRSYRRPSPENHHVPTLLALRIGDADSAVAQFEAGCLSEHALTFFHP